MTPETAAIIQAVAAVSAVVVTVALAAITAYYAWATRGMLDEMRAAREHALAPRVLAYAEPGEHGPTLVVRNLGGSPAFGIRIVNMGPNPLPLFLERRTIAVGESLVDDLFLAPQQAIATLAGITMLGSKPEDLPPAQIDVSWRNEDGDEGRARSVVAFGSVMFAVREGSLNAVAEGLRDIRSELMQRRYNSRGR